MWRFRASVVVLLLGACGAAAAGWSVDGTDAGAGGQGDAHGAGRAALVRRAAGRAGRAERPAAHGSADARSEAEAATDTTADEGDDDPAARETSVSGRVVDADGAPIHGALVACFIGVEACTARTDRSGAFCADVAREPTGVVRCLAWADGWAVAVLDWRALRAGDRIDVGTIRLAPAARITGRIVDPEGEALWGRVRIDGSAVFGAETWALIARATEIAKEETVHSGRYSCRCHGTPRYSIDSLPPGTYRLTPDAYRRHGDSVVVTAPAENVDLHVAEDARPDPFDVELRFVDAEGAPTDAVAESCRVRDGDFDWTPDRDGRAVRISASYVPCNLSVVTKDGRKGSASVGPDAGAVEIRLLPPPRTLSIAGRVTSQGAPLTWTSENDRCNALAAGVRVTLFARRGDGTRGSDFVTSAEDGTFRIDGLEPGTYEICAEVDNAITRGPKLAPARVGADAGQVGLDVDLPVALSQRFRLDLDPAMVPPGADVPTDPDDLDEIDADIHATDTSLDDPDSTDWTTCDGEFVVTGLRPHVAYVLTVRAKIGGVWTARARVTGWTGAEAPRSGPAAAPAGGPRDVVTSADGRAGEVPAPIPVRLATSPRITGRVVRADGSPVVGAYIYGEIADPPGDDELCADAYSDLDGRFTLTGTEDGAWTLEASAPGLSNEGTAPVVRAGSEDVTIVVAPAAR